MDKIKRYISSFIFIVFLFISIIGMSKLLENKEAQRQYKDFFEDVTDIDVIFMGTSHMYNTIYPMDLWKDYGIASYNWGYSNCSPIESYYILRDIINVHKPKLVVFDVYGVSSYEEKYRHDRIEQQHVQFDAIPLSKNKLEGINDIFGDYENRVDFVWDYIMYHNRWDELSKKDFILESHSLKGADPLIGIKSISSYETVEDNETAEITSIQLKYYNKIIEFCKNEGIELLVLNVPYNASKKQIKMCNKAIEIAKNNGCKTISFNELYNIVDFELDLYESDGHVNVSGGKKITQYVGKFIIDNYNVLNQSNNEKWKNDYKEYQEYEIDSLKKQSDEKKYLMLLQNKEFNNFIYIKEGYKETEFETKQLDNITNINTYQESNSNIQNTINEIVNESNVNFVIATCKTETGELIDCVGFRNGKVVRKE